MSQTSATPTNSGFFPGYFNGNGNNQATIPSMSAMTVPPPPVDTSQPPPPPPPPSLVTNPSHLVEKNQ